MIPHGNFKVIFNDKKKNYCLLLINLAEFLNFDVIQEEITVKYGKTDIIDVYNYYMVVFQKFGSNFPC